MADVTNAFLQGRAAAQAEAQHEQLLAENKLRTQVLQHEIGRMKLEDQLRAREVARSNLELLHGQPLADMPTEQVQQSQPDLPATSLGRYMTGLIRDRMTPGDTTPAPTLEAPYTAPAGTNTVTTTRPQAVQIPGVGDQPGVSVRPQSMEDLIRQRIAAQDAAEYNLAPGETRYRGTTPIAKGGPKLVPVGAGGLVDEGTLKQVAPGRGAPVRGGIKGTLNGQDVFGEWNPNVGAYTVAGQPAPGFKPEPSAAQLDAGDKKARQQWEQDFRQYSGEVAQKQRAHAEALRQWNTRYPAGIDPTSPTGAAAPPPPEYAAPSFDEWRATRPTAPAAKPGAPAKTPAAKSVKQPTNPLWLADPTGKLWKFDTKDKADAARREMGIQ